MDLFCSPALPCSLGSLEKMHRNKSCGRSPWVCVTRGVSTRCGRRRLGFKISECWWLNPRQPVAIHLRDDIIKTGIIGAFGDIDGDDVGVDVYRIDLPCAQESTCKYCTGTIPIGVVNRDEPLMPLTGQGAVQFKPDDARRGTGPASNTDHLTHNGRESSAAQCRPPDCQHCTNRSTPATGTRRIASRA